MLNECNNYTILNKKTLKVHVSLHIFLALSVSLQRGPQPEFNALQGVMGWKSLGTPALHYSQSFMNIFTH